jgi:diadenylate cyclase
MLNQLQELYTLMHGTDILDVLIVTLGLFLTLRFLRGTRSVQVIQGLVLIIAVTLIVSVIAVKLHLDTLSWIMEKFWAVFIVALVVVFAPEIRRAFTQLGQRRIFRRFFKPEPQVFIEITQAAATLSKRKIGALIVIERETSLSEFVERGVELDAKVNAELLVSVFMPYSPLHDGALIIQANRMISAGVLLPLSQQENLSRELGSRHYAALGITEETDAAVVVVSEETGTISFAQHGELIRGLDSTSLRKTLQELYGYHEEEDEES